jgi:hypothetical protein
VYLTLDSSQFAGSTYHVVLFHSTWKTLTSTPFNPAYLLLMLLFAFLSLSFNFFLKSSPFCPFLSCPGWKKIRMTPVVL